MKHMADVQKLSQIEAVTNGNSKFIVEMNNTCFSAAQICGSTRGLMSRHEGACSCCLQAFQRMILNIIEGSIENALMSLTTLIEFVKQMVEDTKDMIEVTIKNAIDQSTASIKFIAGEEDAVHEQLKEKTKKKNKAEKEKLRFERNECSIETAIANTKGRENVRKEKRATLNEAKLIAKNVSIAGVVGTGAAAGAVVVLEGAVGTAVVGTVAVGTAAAGSTAVGTAAAVVGTAAVGSTAVGTAAAAVGTAVAGSTANGTAAGTAAAGSTAVGTAMSLGVTGALIATPVFLSVGVVGGIVYVVNRARTGALEVEICEQRNARNEMIELVAGLEDFRCGIGQAELLKCWFITGRRFIMGVKTGLQELQTGWKEMANTCGYMVKLLEETRTHLQGDCRDVLKSDAFKRLVIQNYASWVALKKFARQRNEAYAASTQRLEQSNAAGKTRQEVEAAREDLRQWMDTEPCEGQDS